MVCLNAFVVYGNKFSTKFSDLLVGFRNDCNPLMPSTRYSMPQSQSQTPTHSHSHRLRLTVTVTDSDSQSQSQTPTHSHSHRLRLTVTVIDRNSLRHMSDGPYKRHEP